MTLGKLVFLGIVALVLGGICDFGRWLGWGSKEPAVASMTDRTSAKEKQVATSTTAPLTTSPDGKKYERVILSNPHTREELMAKLTTERVPGKAMAISEADLQDYVSFCEVHDPIQRENAWPIVQYASRLTGTPADLLLAKWEQETDHSAGGAGGPCSLEYEATRRDAMKDRDDRDKWHRSDWSAARRIAEKFEWNSERLTGSCTYRDREGVAHGAGGAWGPFQSDPRQVAEYVEMYGINPLTLCGGALYAGLHFKSIHDEWERKHHDGQGWKRSTDAYIGGANVACNGRKSVDGGHDLICNSRENTYALREKARLLLARDDAEARIAKRVTYEKP